MRIRNAHAFGTIAPPRTSVIAHDRMFPRRTIMNNDATAHADEYDRRLVSRVIPVWHGDDFAAD